MVWVGGKLKVNFKIMLKRLVCLLARELDKSKHECQCHTTVTVLKVKQL